MSKVPRTIKPGSVVVIPMPDSNIPTTAEVVRQDPRDGSLMVRTKRFPTLAQIESGNFTWWVKTPKRVQHDEVLRVIAKPKPNP